MNQSIRAILFDVGGTLRVTDKTEAPDLSHIRNLQAFIGETGDLHEFIAKLHQREKQYRRWCKRSLIELSEGELWSRFMLPDHPAEFIRPNGVKLNQMWRHLSNKAILPDAVETVKTLVSRGYALAIISNTTSSVEAPEMLEANGIADLFSPVILSAVYGRRKPHPSLFLSAAREMGVDPAECAYIGDNLSRDLVGARQAGYGAVVIINVNGYQVDEFDPDDEALLDTITEIQPEYRIGRLSELLDIFPPRSAETESSGQTGSAPARFYDAALSTKWNVDQEIPFNDTFALAQKSGFVRFELNHKVTPELYRQWDSNRFYVSTVHDPCPSILAYREMKQSDRLVSSLDENKRLEAVDMIKRSIDLACRLGSRSVVIHPGTLVCDHSRFNRLRELFQQGRKNTPEYETLKKEMFADRERQAPPHLQRVEKSLTEVIRYARDTGISIGLENRARYYDIPLPDELECFLDACREDWFGFQFDSGHAHVLHTLGCVDELEWLQRFGNRMIGAHLHDVIGITDHQVPGLGDVDFRKIAPYLPGHALRTLEINPEASLPEIETGLEVLVASGCIQRI